MVSFKSFKMSAGQELMNGDKVDPKVQEMILSSPEVQAAMKKSGEQALQDPEVQNAILKVAKENMTKENAEKVANMAKEWAQDPAVQAKARHYAGMAMAFAGQAGQNVVGCIEQGPAGVQFLCFVASIASMARGGMVAFHSMTSLNILHFFVGCFQLLFAFTTTLFESDPKYVDKFKLGGYQDMLMEYAKFMCNCMGRGLFYIFQGIMWWMNCENFSLLNLMHYVDFGLGGFLILMGILHILMAYDIMPQEVAVKVKDAVNKQGYAQLNESDSKA
jgi:hypothetical protein